MLFHVQHYVQISGRASESSNFACAGKANSRSAFNAGGNFSVHGALAKDAAFAFALRARIGDDAARSLAGRAGASDAEEALLIADLAPSIAGAASRSALSRRRTGTTAIFASLVTANRDFSLCAEEGLLELESQVFAEIGAALHATATPSSPSTAPKHVPEPEELAEDVAKVLEDGGIETGRLTGAAAESGMA